MIVEKYLEQQQNKQQFSKQIYDAIYAELKNHDLACEGVGEVLYKLNTFQASESFETLDVLMSSAISDFLNKHKS